ncbi:hypothetical protein ZC03_012 [Pseudomonas phage ZC03]|uniref:Single-stranded DNA-binding protein n=1 Tax=Pseudomonas phage ZC03 TaxID=1622115 RepID=A0A1L2C917_9CAUD|nr:single strand DNA binding protein [Pseudomonas phage ZC03]AMD43399.1 hypothetical protein ZC03_012 [Pseudomonas phage ZC03]
MSLLKKLNTGGKDVEQAKDTLGGGSFIRESNIYIAEIVVAYLTESQNGATAVNFEFKMEDGNNYRETIYVSNRDGETFYSKDGKKYPLPGFTTVDNICMITTEKGLAEQETEDKTLMLWDFESGKEIPREVPVLVELTGQSVALGILHVKENKTAKNESTGKYEPINEARELNTISAVFHPEAKVTVNEAMEGRDPAFWDAWLKRNEGRLVDKYKEVQQRGSRASSKASTSSSAPARKSMFKKD